MRAIALGVLGSAMYSRRGHLLPIHVLFLGATTAVMAGAVPSSGLLPSWLSSVEGCMKLHSVSRDLCPNTRFRSGLQLDFDSCLDACNRMGSDCWAIEWVDGEPWWVKIRVPPTPCC